MSEWCGGQIVPCTKNSKQLLLGLSKKAKNDLKNYFAVKNYQQLKTITYKEWQSTRQ